MRNGKAVIEKALQDDEYALLLDAMDFQVHLKCRDCGSDWYKLPWRQVIGMRDDLTWICGPCKDTNWRWEQYRERHREKKARSERRKAFFLGLIPKWMRKGNG